MAVVVSLYLCVAIVHITTTVTFDQGGILAYEQMSNKARLFENKGGLLTDKARFLLYSHRTSTFRQKEVNNESSS